MVHAPWREVLSGTPQSSLHLYSICEYSVKAQDKLVESTMRKALGSDIPCQFHGAFVSSELLKQGQVQLTLLVQLGAMEQAKEALKEIIAAGPHFIAGKRS